MKHLNSLLHQTERNTVAISLQIEGVVAIDDLLYCKTPEAFDEAIRELRALGYAFKDDRDASISTFGRTREQQWLREASAAPGQLQTARVGKCGSCRAYISTSGIQTHGHICEHCGAVTYYELVEGSSVSFRFTGAAKNSWLPPELMMVVKRWDTNEGYLYLKYGFRAGGLTRLDDADAIMYLDQNVGKWEIVMEGGEKLLKVRYELRIPHRFDDTDVIRIMDSFGAFRNFETLELWDLREYPDLMLGSKHLPLPTFVYLNQAWRWAPLGASSTIYKTVLEAGGTHDLVDGFMQWPEITWTPETYEKMAQFIEHFTVLDENAFRRMIPGMPRDPIVGIERVREFFDPSYVARPVQPRSPASIGLNALRRL